MRTRFLDVDFFHLSSSKAAEISVFRLPIPQASAPIVTPDIGFSSFDIISGISAGLDQLPFENALSQFLQGALPSSNEFQGNAISIAGETESNCRNVTSEAPQFEVIEEEIEVHDGGKSEDKFKEIAFEIPEIDFLQEEGVCTNDEKDGRIHFEICNVRIPLDVLDNQLGNTVPYPCEISASVFSIEGSSAQQHPNQNYDAAELCSLSDGMSCASRLLNFEISEIDLEPYSFLSMEDEFHSILSSVGKRYWVDKDDLLIDCKELLVPPNIDMLLLLGQDPSMEILESHRICLHLLIDINFIFVRDGMNLPKPSAISLRTAEDDCSSVASMIHFHEVEILDLEDPQSFQVFDNIEASSQSEMSGKMLREDSSSIGSFYESIVNTELALVDNKFKSLPVPILCDDKEKMYISATLEDILDRVRMYPSSACDGIYLDWYLLQIDACNNYMWSALENLLERVDTYEIASDLESMTDRSTIDFFFYDQSPDELNSTKFKDIPNDVPAAVSMVNDALSEKTMGQLVKDENQKNKYGEPELLVNCEKVSMLMESMSQFNDLSFFLNARKYTAGRNSEDAKQDKSDRKISASASCRGPVVTSSSSDTKFQQGDVEIHEIELSDYILSLIENIQKNFSAILISDTNLKANDLIYKSEDDFKLLSISKKRLMDLIKEKAAQGITPSSEDGSLMKYVTLYAIKQTVYYLCFYGIDSAYLYVRNLSQSLRNMKSNLNLLLSLIEEAKWKAEDGPIETHPSLFVVEQILGLNSSQRVGKVMFIAQKAFWRPLESKLKAMNISVYKVKNVSSCGNQPDIHYTDEFLKSLQNALLQIDGILISHELVFPSFPFNKFGIILEYGGSCSTSRTSSFSSTLVGLPRIHFLRVKIEEPGELKALYEESDDSLYPAQTMEGPSLPDWQGSSNSQQYVELLNFIPVMDKDTDWASGRVACDAEAFRVPGSKSSMSFTKEQDFHLAIPSSPEKVIIINTQTCDKEMLIFRRSSYQKFLAMEKEGVQVVEREFNLPVDLIFSADVCLAWYDARNFRMSSRSLDKASLCIPDCMDNIATNILMSLSFAFRSCTLVFEGDRSFLTAIMESSDGLYASAASLDMHLQLFCSYSSELTDEIILNCIRHASKFNQGIYSPMPESETLAESFLTNFPSINPLSAQAILSSGVTLGEFLELSKEQRIQVVGKYHVPVESITLFSALCKYGELGESKSVMTECSSALSSATEPEYSSCKMQSERKDSEYNANNQSYDMPIAKHLPFKPLHKSEHSLPMFHRASWPHHPRVFPDCVELLRKSKEDEFSLKEPPLNKEQDFSSFLMDDLDWTGMFGTDVNVEANTNDMCNMPLADDFSCLANTGCVSRGAPHVSKKAAGDHNVTEKSSFSMRSLPMRPTSAEMDSGLDIWFSLNDHERKLEENIYRRLDIELNKEASHNKRQGEFLEESQMRKSTRNALGLSSRQKVTPPYGKTPLTNVAHLSQIQQGSPWAIEFLNKIKEKKDKSDQSLLCNTCIDCYGSSKKIDKFVKRQSPSTIDSYRYQGSGSIKRTIQQKMYKDNKKPLRSMTNEKKDSPFDPTWTPIDKRARQILSFTRNGNEKQSKLVWSDSNVQSLRKRLRDE